MHNSVVDYPVTPVGLSLVRKLVVEVLPFSCGCLHNRAQPFIDPNQGITLSTLDKHPSPYLFTTGIRNLKFASFGVYAYSGFHRH